MNRIEHYATYIQGGAGAAARRIFDGLYTELVTQGMPNTGPVSDSGSVLPLRRTTTWELAFRCRNDQELEGEATEHFEPSGSFFDRTWPRKWNRRSFKQAAKHYHKHLKHRPPQYEVFSPARLYEPTARPQKPEVDLIHLHWVAFLLDYQTFFRSIPRAVPVVWTLHDMNAFTGGCHYSAGCSRYLSGCGSCGQLDNAGDSDLSAVAWKQKKHAYGTRALTIVTPSRWLTNLATQSRMFSPETRFETIHYGLDTQVYRPIDKRQAKEKLNLSGDRTTLLFGAADVSNLRKGLKPLVESLSRLPEPEKYECVVFGDSHSASEVLKPISRKMNVRELGFLATDDDKRIAYSAADLFLLPSLEDNQPQTGLEAMACGTPVVAFDAGGISEFVQHGKTGLLAEVNDADNLAKQIRWLSESPESQKSFSLNGRNLILEEFEIRRQTKKYAKLYRQLIAEQTRSSRVAA